MSLRELNKLIPTTADVERVIRQCRTKEDIINEDIQKEDVFSTKNVKNGNPRTKNITYRRNMRIN